MRNLKKVLSLALALVMLLGMMVVGAGAATSFKDDVDIQNKEAVAVLVGLGVMKGREDGSNFEPNATLTRAEAAKMIAQLDLGVEAADALKANGNNTFSDVWSDYWAAGPIDYCVERGYIAGDGAGHFFPNQNVTGVQFASMLLRLLGYDAKVEKLVGDQWAVNAASLARKAGLTTKVLANNEDMTRDGMAQMSFNALTAPMVEYKGMNITVGDATFNSPATIRLHDITLEGSKNITTYDGGKPTATTPIRLCEERFPYLKLTTTAEDGFGHTASVWTYRSAEIKGSETTVTPDYVTNTKVLKGTPDWAKIDDMYIVAPDASGRGGTEIYVNGFKGYSTTSFNGVTYPAGKLSDSKITASGRLVEVYLNEANLNVIDKIVVTDTALATVYKVNSDGTIKVKLEKTDLEKKDAAKGFFVQGAVVLNTDEDETVVYDGPKVGDVVLVKGYNDTTTTPVIGKPDDDGAQQTTLVSVELAEEMKAFVSKKTYKEQEKASYLTVRGDDHDYKDAFNVVADYTVNDFEPNDKNYDSTLYLDEYQNIMKVIMGVDPNATTDNLIAVAEYYETVLDGKITGMVKGVLSNGETVNFPLKDRSDSTKTPEGIYTYTLAEGRYTLAKVTNRTSGDISTSSSATAAQKSTHVANVGLNKTISFKSSDVLGKENASSYLLSDDVKFIFVKNGEISVANGRQTYDYENANVLAQALVKSANNSYQVRAVFIMAEPDIADISDIIYVHSTYRNNTVIKDLENGKQVKQYGYNAYDANGEKIEDFVGFNDKLAGQFYKKDLDQYDAQKDTKGNVVKKHTLLPAGNDPANSIAVNDKALWITQANGKTGDAFTVSDGEVGGTTLRFISGNTKVVDLSGSGRNISSVSELNDAVFDGYGDTQVAVIFNTSGDNNNVLIAKTVFVTKCEKAPVHATGTPAGSVDQSSGKYTVSSTLSGDDELEFTKAAAGSTAPAEGAKWGSSVTAEKDEVVFVRAANKTGKYAELGSVTTAVNVKTGATVTFSATSNSTVYSATMPEGNVVIYAATVNKTEVERGFLDTTTLGTPELNLRLVSGDLTSASTTADKNKLAGVAASWLKSKGYADAKVNYALLADRSTEATGVTVTVSGTEITVALADINAKDDYGYATVKTSDGKVNTEVVLDAAITGKKSKDFMALLGITKMEDNDTIGSSARHVIVTAADGTTVTYPDVNDTLSANGATINIGKLMAADKASGYAEFTLTLANQGNNYIGDGSAADSAKIADLTAAITGHTGAAYDATNKKLYIAGGETADVTISITGTLPKDKGSKAGLKATVAVADTTNNKITAKDGSNLVNTLIAADTTPTAGATEDTALSKTVEATIAAYDSTKKLTDCNITVTFAVA